MNAAESREPANDREGYCMFTRGNSGCNQIQTSSTKHTVFLRHGAVTCMRIHDVPDSIFQKDRGPPKISPKPF